MSDKDKIYGVLHEIAAYFEAFDELDIYYGKYEQTFVGVKQKDNPTSICTLVIQPLAMVRHIYAGKVYINYNDIKNRMKMVVSMQQR